ncbi:hypothetical protein OF117_16455 [Geodermatophilus sp. YIM 151500]|nr:hypothetical protein [Geodermatophilus sp. YIM 151500]MCV2490948.1 hypothetical protein [Geodermatophilus sp. YIM 151500]
MPAPYGVRGGWRATSTDNLLEPASALPALELTLDVQQRLAATTG